MSYARCYSPVTLFISGYACKHGCDVTACFPVLFYNINWKWTPCVYLTWCKNSMEFGRMWKYLCKPSPAACVNKLSNSPKLSLVFASGFINTGDHIVYFLNNNLMFVCVHTNTYKYIYIYIPPQIQDVSVFFHFLTTWECFTLLNNCEHEQQLTTVSVLETFLLR